MLKTRCRYLYPGVLSGTVLMLAGAAAPARAVAQPPPPPPQARQDSVLAIVRALERRLDSLEAVIARLRASEEDAAEPIDELAALRAAARAAAGEAAEAAPPVEGAPAATSPRSGRRNWA